MISAFLNPIILSLGPSTITGLSQPMKAPVGLIAPPQLRFCIVGKIMLAAFNICWMYHSVWTVIEYLPDCSDSSLLSYAAPLEGKEIQERAERGSTRPPPRLAEALENWSNGTCER